jgi:hypothetical protein
MKTRNHSMAPAAAGLLALLLSGATATGMAQTPTPAPGKMPQHKEGMQGMSGMMGGPHHVLARPAVAEMRRSFDQMRQHHQAQMAMMGDSTKPAMSGTMQHMETHLTALSEHLTALESEVNAGTPDPKKVSEHSTEILKQCAAMSAMPPKAKPHQME